MLGDVKDPRLMWLKAGLLLVAGVLAGAIVVYEAASWRVAIALGLCVWAFCRLYYFLFYVLERYVDPESRFAGLAHMIGAIWKRRRR
jgi:hypothetical protein